MSASVATSSARAGRPSIAAINAFGATCAERIRYIDGEAALRIHCRLDGSPGGQFPASRLGEALVTAGPTRPSKAVMAAVGPPALECWIEARIGDVTVAVVHLKSARPNTAAIIELARCENVSDRFFPSVTGATASSSAPTQMHALASAPVHTRMPTELATRLTAIRWGRAWHDAFASLEHFLCEYALFVCLSLGYRRLKIETHTVLACWVAHTFGFQFLFANKGQLGAPAPSLASAEKDYDDALAVQHCEAFKRDIGSRGVGPIDEIAARSAWQTHYCAHWLAALQPLERALQTLDPTARLETRIDGPRGTTGPHTAAALPPKLEALLRTEREEPRPKLQLRISITTASDGTTGSRSNAAVEAVEIMVVLPRMTSRETGAVAGISRGATLLFKAQLEPDFKFLVARGLVRYQRIAFRFAVLVAIAMLKEHVVCRVPAVRVDADVWRGLVKEYGFVRISEPEGGRRPGPTQSAGIPYYGDLHHLVEQLDHLPIQMAPQAKDAT